MKVFLLAGQSNMRGQSRTDLLDDTMLPIKNLIFYENSCSPSQVGFNYKKSSVFTHGPEIGFADQMCRHLEGEEFIIIKYSENGSSLYDWSPKWNKKQAKITEMPSYGSLYNKATNVVDSVLEQYQTTLSGICWMQGCRDSKFKRPANEYFDNFKLLIESFRKRYGDIPVAYGKVSPPGDGRFKYKDIVRAHQERASVEILKMTIICTDEFEKPDNLHYGLSGNLSLGKSFADIMHSESQ